MTIWGMLNRVAALCAAFQLFGTGMVRADVITNTATLPLLNVPYISTSSLGCFAAAGVCFTPGIITVTSVVSSTFNPSGQDIVSDITAEGELTSLTNVPIGPVTLTGTLEQEVLGRTTSDETGSWTTDITGLYQTGTVLGETLTVVLDGTQTSSGTTSIIPLGGPGSKGSFDVNSFFDVFVDITLDSTPPLNTSRGPVDFVASVPEPATWSLIGVAVLSLIAARHTPKTRRPIKQRV